MKRAGHGASRFFTSAPPLYHVSAHWELLPTVYIRGSVATSWLNSSYSTILTGTLMSWNCKKKKNNSSNLAVDWSADSQWRWHQERVYIYIQFYDSMFILKLHAATFTMNLTAEGSWGMIRNYFTGREGVHIYDIWLQSALLYYGWWTVTGRTVP